MVRKKKGLGAAFTDEVAKVTQRVSNFNSNLDEDWKESLLFNFKPAAAELDLKEDYWKKAIFLSLTLIIFFILLLRLFHLQIIQGQKNRELADGNRVQVKVIHAPRGVIYDRQGKILAANSPGFRLIDAQNKSLVLTREEALSLEVNSDPRAKNLEIDTIRTYPFKESLAHILGYVGQISSEELRGTTYTAGDRIGQMGVEKQYEKLLKGVDGGEIIEVDSLGKKLRTIRTISPIPGQDLTLTIDSDLQNFLYKTLSDQVKKSGSCCGAAIIEDPNNGQILALVSIPSFDNNLFTTGGDEQAITNLLTRADSPILNRSITGQYPPGSTFKIISSLAALTSGKITAQNQFEDTGEIYLGSFRFTNWYFTQYGGKEGMVDIIKALKRSNDTYFYRVGQTIGEVPIIEWSKKLHLGEKLGIDLPGEETGLIPDEAWKKKTFNEVWFPGDTLHLSIGQGFVLTTPLHVLGFTSFVASGGNLYKPQLLLDNFKAEKLVSNIITSSQLKYIKQGLTQVPQEGGTAWPLFNFPVPSAGKTGTAEYGDPKGRTHAWYSAFAPVENPQIAIVVLIEGGGEGSSVAAPVVKEIFRWYFSPDKNKLIPDKYGVASESARTLGE